MYKHKIILLIFICVTIFIFTSCNSKLDRNAYLGDPYSLKDYSTEKIYNEILYLMNNVPDVGIKTTDYRDSFAVKTKVMEEDGEGILLFYCPLENESCVRTIGLDCNLSSNVSHEMVISGFLNSSGGQGFLFVRFEIYNNQEQALELYNRFSDYFSSFYENIEEKESSDDNMYLKTQSTTLSDNNNRVEFLQLTGSNNVYTIVVKKVINVK